MSSSHPRKLELDVWRITDEGSDEEVHSDSPNWEIIERVINELGDLMKVELSASDGMDLSYSQGAGLVLESECGAGPLISESLAKSELLSRFNLFYQGRTQELIDLDWDIIGYGKWNTETGDIQTG